MNLSSKRVPSAPRRRPASSSSAFAACSLNASSLTDGSWKRVAELIGLVAALPTPNHRRWTMKLRSIAIDSARRTRASPSGLERWLSSIQDSGP